MIDADVTRAKRAIEDGSLQAETAPVTITTRAGESVVSDDEVFHEAVSGHFWYFHYPVVDPRPGEPAHVTIATTRPETMLGDTAVAVHPEDPRFAGLAGLQVDLPLTDRTIPVIQDDWVDPEFGTGAVKVTPAHDPNDFEIARRHGLPSIDILTATAQISDQAPAAFRGMDRFDARRAVVDAFEAEVDTFIAEATQRAPRKDRIRLAYLGVPPIVSGLYEFLEGVGARVVFNETQRQFTMPYGIPDLVEQYRAYTYPYDVFHRIHDCL